MSKPRHEEHDEFVGEPVDGDVVLDMSSWEQLDTPVDEDEGGGRADA